MRPRTDNPAGAFVLSLLLHVALVVVAWLGSLWVSQDSESAQGEPVGATLKLSAADLRRAEQAVAAAQKAHPEPPSEAAPQPLPAPAPQTADIPPQPAPQEQLDKPDTVEQEQVVRNAIDPSAAQAEQERRQRQEQVELTEAIARQQEAERRQRLKDQLEAIRVQRAEAAKATRMEEQRLAQLADRAAAPPAPTRPTHPAPPNAGAPTGADAGLLARYHAAMLATAKANWTSRGLAPELVTCQVRFVQIPGGEVINIEFMDCPYDAQGRESVERALHMTPMPYSGFEAVFERKVVLDFCYPDEACTQ